MRLNKESCMHCIKDKRWGEYWYWSRKDEKQWIEKKLYCPAYGNIDIEINPVSKRCPYVLEHVVLAQKESKWKQKKQ